MTKEEYVIQKNKILGEMAVLQDSLFNLNDAYKKDNRIFKDGDRVKITNGREVRYGIVYGYKIGYRDELVPLLYKMKKDGTASKVRDYIWGEEKIELSE